VTSSTCLAFTLTTVFYLHLHRHVLHCHECVRTI
jgi:hypothetical protein